MAEELAGLRADVSLASRTTLGLGGSASELVIVERTADLVDAVQWADARGLPIRVLGGGSNLVVADEGVRALVVVSAVKDFEVSVEGEDVLVVAGAGLDWDETVARTVDEGWCGLECLAGIPGTVGATPIQNVGAYGREVADVLAWVEAFDRQSRAMRRLSGDECAFAYRSSRFRSHPDRWIVTRVALRLQRRGTPELAYPELKKAVAATGTGPHPGTVRDIVLDLRRRKGMVIEDGWVPSAGSFFVNPVVDANGMTAIERRAGGRPVPRFGIGDGAFKVPAAWLIEEAGFAKGTRRGAVGLSVHHALAVVHHGGGTTAQLVAFAGSIRTAVEARFGVRLRPEPVFWGFDSDDPLNEADG